MASSKEYLDFILEQLSEFDDIATIRSREISACLVLQAKSQLKAIYEEVRGTANSGKRNK